MLVQLLGRADLLELAFPHDDDEIAQRHRLGLIVRHVDRRHLQVSLDPEDLGTHLHAQLRVEVRQRLVHQERLRLANDRASHRHALPLAARELARPFAEKLLQVEDLRCLLHPPFDLLLLELSDLQAQAPCSDRRSCADTGRSSGRPSRCRGRPGGTSFTTRSPIAIVPSVRSSRPAIIRSTVVLPHPDGPTRTIEFAVRHVEVD